MSTKPDGGALIGNHVGHHAALPTVDECDEDSAETTSTPPDETTPLDPDVEGPTGEEDDDVDEPMAVSSSELTLSDTEAKEALPEEPGEVTQPVETAAEVAESGDPSTSSSEDFDPTTIVRGRRGARAFVGDAVDLDSFKRRAAELGYSDEDDDDDDEWESSDDEYVGLIPMLCARCVRCLRHYWFERRAKRFLVMFNVLCCVRIYQPLSHIFCQLSHT